MPRENDGIIIRDDSSLSRIKLQWWRRVSLATMPRENDGIVIRNDSSLSRNAPKGALQWWRRVHDATRKLGLTAPYEYAMTPRYAAMQLDV